MAIFARPKTVANVLQAFHNTVAELDYVRERSEEDAAHYEAMIAESTAAKLLAQAEATRAQNASTAFKNLIGTL